MINSFPETQRVLERERAADGCGYALRVCRRDEPVLELFHSGGDRPITATTRLSWLCSGKPLLAVAAATTFEARRLSFDTPITEFLDMPGTGLGLCSVRHLLSHTVPYQKFGIHWPLDRKTRQAEVELIYKSPEQADREIKSAKIIGLAGERAVYSSLVSWQLLGEILAVVTGRPVGQCIAQTVACPLGMDTLEFGGGESLRHSNEDSTGTSQRFLWPAWGMTGSGSISDMMRPVQAILRASNGGDPGCGLSRTQAEIMISRQRPDLPDPLLTGCECSWGLGVSIEPRQFGQPHSASVFGHVGFRQTFVFADREHDLCIGFARTLPLSFGGDLAQRRRIIGAVAADLVF